MSFFRDSWIVFKRAIIISSENPMWIAIGLLQPILYLTLFGPLLTQIAGMPGFPPGDAWLIFVPGLLVQLGIFGGAFVGLFRSAAAARRGARAVEDGATVAWVERVR